MPDKLKQLLDPTFYRFLLVGILNTLVGTAVMFLLYNVAGLHRWGNAGYWLSTVGNYTVGSVLSFFLNRSFTFRSRERGPAVVARFVVNIAVCMTLAYGIAKRAVAWALAGSALSQQLQGNLSMTVGMGLFVLLNYFGQRFFTFRQQREDPK